MEWDNLALYFCTVPWINAANLVRNKERKWTRRPMSIYFCFSIAFILVWPISLEWGLRRRMAGNNHVCKRNFIEQRIWMLKDIYLLEKTRANNKSRHYVFEWVCFLISSDRGLEKEANEICPDQHGE